MSRNASRTVFLIYLTAAAFVLVRQADAMPFEVGDNSGFFDTALSYGMAWRTEKPNEALIGVGNGGTANSVNADDGNQNYARGNAVSGVLKATHDAGLTYKNHTGFIRASYFVDFVNINKEELTDNAQDGAGRGFDLLDAYVRGHYKLFDRNIDLRIGRQAINWGESTFIQNGINIVNPVDLARLRTPGSEIREALLPTFMVSGSIALSDQLTLESFYLFEADTFKLEVCGTFFSTSDIVCERSEKIVYTGSGQFPEETPDIGSPLLDDRLARDQGQVGAAIRYFSKELFNTEFGIYYINYHSRLPYTSAVSAENGPSGFLEYPEDITLLGTSFNTELGATGLAFQGEYSFRPNYPLQVEQNEVLLAAAGLPFSQLEPVSALGDEVSGYKRYDVGQLQGTLTKAFGNFNPFFADEWIVIGEAALTNVFGMPSIDILRFEAPETDLPAVPLPTTPGVQESGWADSFSWGYVVFTSTTYNQAVGPINLNPSLAFSHDVSGTTPGPAGNFIEGRKSLNLSLRADYLTTWSAGISYNRFFGAGARNSRDDRDFIGFDLKYSF